MPDDRTVSVLNELATRTGAGCRDCASPLCGHQVVMSLMLGFKDAPRCLDCLARGLDQERDAFLSHLREHAARRACWSAGWRAAGASCRAHGEVEMEDERCDGAWDAGDMGCGDLVMVLRQKMLELRSGQVLKVSARDPGAPADLPAWCGMTGHALLKAEPPVYWIRRK